MAKQIVAVRMDGGTEHHHIAGVAYVFLQNATYDANTLKVADVVSKIKAGERFFTRDWAGEEADVVIVTSGSTTYIRTKKDGVLRDNLLRLPRYS
jgi:hypothetical protein